jgi:hypothetical protein
MGKNNKIIYTLVIGFFLTTSALNISALNVSNNSLITLNDNPSDNAEWTVMIYMCADNALEDAADIDLDHIRSSTRFIENNLVNIIVLFDRYGKGNTNLYKIEEGIIKTIEDNGSIIPDNNEVNMGNPQTLTNFCNWAIENYPANHYFLDLWGNGNRYRYNGHTWFFRVCVDAYNGVDTIDIFNELGQSLNDITNKLGHKIDIIGFDACLTGLIEVAYEIRPFANYMIASQDTGYIYTVSGTFYGWQYYNPLNKLLKNPTYYAYNPDKLCEEFVNNYLEDTQFDKLSTLSALDLDKIDDLASEISLLGDQLYEYAIEERDYIYIKVVLNAQDKAKDFRYRWPSGSSYCGCYGDLLSFVNLISKGLSDRGENNIEITNTIKSINDLVEEIVIANYNCNNDDASGISINVHTPNCGSCYISNYRNLLFSNDKKWDEFVLAIENCWSNNKYPDDPIVDGAPIAKIGDEYELTVEVNDPDNDGLYINVYWGINAYDDDAYSSSGPYDSGEKAIITHTYKKSDFDIRDPEVGLIITTRDPWGKSSSAKFYVDLTRAKGKTIDLQLFNLFSRMPFILKLLEFI